MQALPDCGAAGTSLKRTRHLQALVISLAMVSLTTSAAATPTPNATPSAMSSQGTDNPDQRVGSMSDYLNQEAAGGKESTSKAGTPPSMVDILERVNQYRALVGVHALAASPALASAATAHSHYVVENYAEQLLNGEPISLADIHREDPKRPFFSKAGNQAAAGDVSFYPSDDRQILLSQVDNLTSGPFHRMQLLQQDINEAGWGFYCTRKYARALCIETLRGGRTAEGSQAHNKAVLFPPANSEVDLVELRDEQPDAAASCPSYASPIGLPITIALGNSVPAKLGEFSLVSDAGKLESCGFDAETYRNPNSADQSGGRSMLHSFGMIVIAPKQPLQHGMKYSVAAKVNGKKYQWSFSVSK